MAEFTGKNPYIAFINHVGYESELSLNDVAYIGHKLDYDELNLYMVDIFQMSKLLLG